MIEQSADREGRGQKRCDRRTDRTRKEILSAMFRLLGRKPLSQITVTEIAKEADINRKTFYTYYANPAAVQDEIEDELVRQFGAAIHDMDLETLMRRPEKFFMMLAKLVEKNLDFYGGLLTKEDLSSVLVKVMAMLKATFVERFGDQEYIDREHFDMVLDFAVAGLVAVYTEWFLQKQKRPLEEVSEELAVLMFQGALGLVQKIQKNTPAPNLPDGPEESGDWREV